MLHPRVDFIRVGSDKIIYTANSILTLHLFLVTIYKKNKNTNLGFPLILPPSRTIL